MPMDSVAGHTWNIRPKARASREVAGLFHGSMELIKGPRPMRRGHSYSLKGPRAMRPRNGSKARAPAKSRNTDHGSPYASTKSGGI